MTHTYRNPMDCTGSTYREVLGSARALRACGCIGDPTGILPPKRHPACGAHAHNTGGCIDCGGCGEVAASWAPDGTGYVVPCPRCEEGRVPRALTAAQVAARPSPRHGAGWDDLRVGSQEA